MGVTDSLTVLPKWSMKIGGLFNRTIKEVAEMAYQNELPYVFDSSKFNTLFGFEPASYGEGIKRTADLFKSRSSNRLP